MSVLGLPPEEQLSFVTHPAARKAIMSRANAKPKDLESYFPADASPLALDLLRRMVSACRSSADRALRTQPRFLFSCLGIPTSSRRKLGQSFAARKKSSEHTLIARLDPMLYLALQRHDQTKFSHSPLNKYSIQLLYSAPAGFPPGAPHHR